MIGILNNVVYFLLLIYLYNYILIYYMKVVILNMKY